MAKRRVNVKFLGIIGAAVIVLLAGALAFKSVHKGDPKKLRDLAERQWKEGNLVDAANNYEKAVSLDMKDLKARNRFGVLLHELALQDPALYGKDRTIWDGVLTVDPTNREALGHVMDLEVEILEYSDLNDVKPVTFTRLREVAERILRTSAADTKAKAYFHISTIAAWMAGIVTPEEVINDNTAALARLQAEDPGNPDVPYFLATAYVRQARELRMRSDTAGAIRLERQADAVFARALEAQPKNAVIRLRAYQVYRMLTEMQDGDETAQDRPDYKKRSREMLEKAKQDITPDDPAFTDVYTAYATFLRRNREPGAEELLRELRAKKPEDQWARLVLASVIHDDKDPKKRAEAIELLKAEIKDQGWVGGVSKHNKIELELRSYTDLTNYLIDSYVSTSDPTKRDQVAADIDTYYHKILDRRGVSEMTLKLKGKIALMKGGPQGAISAIPDLEKARDLCRELYGTKKDWDLEYLLAVAYFEGNQTGPAKAQLQMVVDAQPTLVQPRILLTKLLLASHETDLAKDQIKKLKELAPNEPQVSKLEMALAMLLPQHFSADQLNKLIATMPEATRAEKMQKIPVYFLGGKTDDAIRLLEEIRKDDPADVEIVRTLVQVYMSQKNKEQATKVVDEAIARQPENISLQIVKSKIANDEKQAMALTLKAVQGIKDPFVREQRLYDFYLMENDEVEAQKHLDAAEKINPEDETILDIRFSNALHDGKWDLAESYANRLGVKNKDEAHGLIYQFRLAMARGDLKKGEETARELVRTLPQFARSWLCYGEVLKAERQFDEAIAKYQIARQKQTENLEAYRGLIECYYLMGKPDDARREILAGLKINPQNSYLKEQKLGWEVQYGDASLALEPRKAAAKANPEAVGAQLAYGAALWQVAQQRIEKNKPDEAKTYIADARNVFGAIMAKWPDHKLAYTYLADIATVQRDFPAGEKALKDLAAREKFKEGPEASQLLAEYYTRFSKFDEAEVAFRDALVKSKNAPEMQRRVAGFYVTQRKYDKALEVLDKNSKDRRIRQQIMEVLIASNRLTDAQQFLSKILAEDENDPQFLAMQGFLLLQQKKLDQSLEALNKAIAVDPRNATALYYRGMIRLRQSPSTSDDAIRDLTAARDINNADNSGASEQAKIQTRTALAEAFRSHSPPMADEAIGELQACVRIQPGKKEARMKLIEVLGALVPPRWAEVEQVLNDAKRLRGGDADADWDAVASTMWAKRNQPEKALGSIRRALQLTQDQPERTLVYMQQYFNVLLQLKKYRELLGECDALLKQPAVADSAWWVYQLRGIANGHIDGKKADAMTDFDHALGIAARLGNTDIAVAVIQSIADSIGLPQAIERCEREAAKGDNHWRVILTYLYFSTQDYAKAESTIEKVLAESDKLTPRERETALGVAGQVYMLALDFKKADEAYQKLLSVSPDDLAALNNLACLWVDGMDPADPAKALTYSKRALALAQKSGMPDPNIMDTHGWVLVCNQQLDDGINYLQASLEQANAAKGAALDTHYHMGMAMLKKNRGAEALRSLEKARKMLDERKNKGQPIDVKLEARLNDGIAKAKQMVNNASAVTNEPSKP